MAARRLLIVMLVLLGISTLAAALVPQRTLNEEDTTGTTTRPTTATSPAQTSETVPQKEITVGPKELPLVLVQAGTQFTLLVSSDRPRELSIPEFGLVRFATPDTPARFELLTETPGTFGILFATSGKSAAQIKVVKHLPPKGERKGKKAKSRARAE
jgi:hypothetical protein